MVNLDLCAGEAAASYIHLVERDPEYPRVITGRPGH